MMRQKNVLISLWEEDNNKNSIVFPVPPEQLPTEVTGKAEVIEILGAGERVVFGGKNLDRFTLDTFFPDIIDPSYVIDTSGAYTTPGANFKKLREWCDKEVPLRLYSKEGYLNRPVVITSLNYDPERYGHIGDIWISVEFTNYVPPTYSKVSIRKVSVGTNSNIKPKPPAKVTLPRSYTIKKGDTLQKIAIAYYGKPNYQYVYETNKKIIDDENRKRKSKTRYTIYPGTVITVMPLGGGGIGYLSSGNRRMEGNLSGRS